jgi:hypothetical protein
MRCSAIGGVGVCPPKAKVTRSNRVGCATKSTTYPKRANVIESKTHHKLTKNKATLAQILRVGGNLGTADRRFLMQFSTRNLAWKNTFAVSGREIWFGRVRKAFEFGRR